MPRRNRKILVLLLCLTAMLLTGCGGGQEIESCLFVIAMAVDPAPDGNLTVTVKALSGSQSGQGGSSQGGGADSADTGSASQNTGGQTPAVEQAEPGYLTLSATAPSCLRALNLLSATTPRTLNLSQLQEIVLSRTLAESGAALSSLKEISSLYRANGSATVVVTPDNAGDFIRRQHALLGVRLSQYLQVLFEHFSSIDTIPPDASLSSVIAAMESSTGDAAAVYASGNQFDSALVLPGSADTDRLPGHLPRTSPAQNEYLGAALFSGAKMTGVLTGSETTLLCLMMGRAKTRTAVIDGTQYKTNVRTRVRRAIEDGALTVSIRMNLTRIAGQESRTAGEIAAQTEQQAAQLLQKLQSLSCDALGFGRLAIRACPDVPSWEASGFKQAYESAPVRVRVEVSVL